MTGAGAITGAGAMTGTMTASSVPPAPRPFGNRKTAKHNNNIFRSPFPSYPIAGVSDSRTPKEFSSLKPANFSSSPSAPLIGAHFNANQFAEERVLRAQTGRGHWQTGPPSKAAERRGQSCLGIHGRQFGLS